MLISFDLRFVPPNLVFSITLAAIRGAFHDTAWAENLDEWISFLLEHK